MFNPVSTYRIQFHKGFTFADFERIIPYIEKLGISTIYASPIFESVPGSMHGYDGINPLKINPEIGTIAQLRKISRKLKNKNISWIQDIVPNHMAYHPDNKWLMDLLANGPSSKYKEYFDQSLSDTLFEGPIMIPFLGDSLDEIIENGQLSIQLKKGKKYFEYSGNYWPLKVDSLPHYKIAIEAINNDKKLLKEIADHQHYRLCSWKETDYKINYRRFFTVNGLICLNIQNDKVFDHFHRLIGELVKEGIFQGLRIDHIDGLFDPEKYLHQLRKLSGEETYIIVEKILEQGEEMPAWPIQGNTGYDFLAMVNNLLTNTKSKSIFDDFYQKLSKNNTPVEEQIRQKKAYILSKQMAGELDNLTRLFFQSDFIREKDLKLIPPNQIKETIAEFIIHCPVYRYYGNKFPLKKSEKTAIKKIFRSVEESKPALKEAINILEYVFLNKKDDAKALHFYQRCMQFTGPLMAKGVEDTLMYTYNRFIAHNEVGDAPDAFGISIANFHKKMKQRQQLWPLSMNGTSTHDTKRGEDARARLNVLTDLPDEWLRTVELWRKINKPLIEKNAPDANDEYFIYETLLGIYPMPGEPEDNFHERIEQYLEKTLREAKLHSDWAEPNENYESSVKEFVKTLLNKKGAFWKSFKVFHQKVSEFGVVNSLTQQLLKLTAPGMPDIYQGCELWDLSMVDPDNRRPVDYKLRDKFIQESIAKDNPEVFWQHKFNGEIKLWLSHCLLKERKENPILFAEAEYIPIRVKGKYRENVMAFARRYRNTWYLVVIPLNMASLCTDPLTMDWANTHLILPDGIPDTYEDLLLKTNGKIKEKATIAELFKTLPLAFLKLQLPKNERGAGILAHITSLPSSFAIGDFGPGAKKFADLLHQANQKYWQLLPLSPVAEKNQFSPYSSWSGLGGNTLLISPELLVEDGLLTKEDIEKYAEPSAKHVDFKTAAWLKDILFEKAWVNYNKVNPLWLKKQFADFCKHEAYWLTDFSVFTVLKTVNDGLPWDQWPESFKKRNKAALHEFELTNAALIQKAKWLQFIFSRQWHQLKNYCHQLDIKLIGDLPFYVSYDSVDVWAHPEIFDLDENKEMKFVAGVPPDYFNANGQLWGMPVFNWDKLKSQNYDWWIQRIRKNTELFDLLRLDHFRAFSSFWSVPAGEETAINGTWEKGPGFELFKAIKESFGKLPFIAEDLGDIDEDVYTLRDELELPGMRVLQFAFGDNMPQSPHIPHNHSPNSIVYTGTHDNNTLKGWFKQEADKKVQANIDKYTGTKVKDKNAETIFIKMALASVAKIAIIPVQDFPFLGNPERMNTPAETDGNWLWRMTEEDLNEFDTNKLKKWTERYNR